MQNLPGRIDSYWESRPSAVKLAVAYALILVVISAVFSVTLYRFADEQLIQGLRHQYARYHGPPGFGGSPFDISVIQAELEAARRQLIMQLAYFNLIILAAGSAMSYWLAKRTVRPIEEALEAQSRFTADASHELRTPLAVMRAEIEIARSDPKITKQDALKLLDSNLEEVNKLNTLAEALLRLARSNGKPIELVPVSTEHVVQDAMGRVSGLAKTKTITILNDTRDFKVKADRHSLVELLAILLENAVKYSGEGSKVTLSSHTKGHSGLIT
ncbi:MAG TPA: HAMP domain-containing sensor histidine kinase, partial [Candidatus Polarisedimenticolaceae bacterium]|nr:HAMP domain-containing sensor histidine kinase [Candidatus Polarisedimenticolaceae bacterium]